MSVYYIINHSGLLKQYYSVKNVLNPDQIKDPVIFSVSLRNAKPFPSYAEANQLILSLKLNDCFVINAYGIQQNK